MFWSCGHGLELVQHGDEAIARHALHARDGLAQALDFLRAQVLEDLGRLLLAQGHQEDRGVLESLFVHACCRPCCAGPQAASGLTQLRMMLATAAGFSFARRRAASSLSLVAGASSWAARR
jgi:hypothetical protein